MVVRVSAMGGRWVFLNQSPTRVNDVMLADTNGDGRCDAQENPPPPPTTKVPNLFGLSSSDASAVLTAHGLVPLSAGTLPIDDRDLNRKVVSVTPATDSVVPVGSTVSYSLGRYVPNGCGPSPC